MRAFLNQPVEPHTGVIECMIRRKKGVMSTIYQAYYEVKLYVIVASQHHFFCSCFSVYFILEGAFTRVTERRALFVALLDSFALLLMSRQHLVKISDTETATLPC